MRDDMKTSVCLCLTFFTEEHTVAILLLIFVAGVKLYVFRYKKAEQD